MEQERVAKDNLKRRFSQTQSDISYTIHMLIPALSEQVLREMDVDSITQELQAHSRARQAGSSLSASIASSIELVHAPQGRERSQDTRSELSDTSFSGSASTQSWVETGGSGESREMILGESVAPVHLSDSLMTTTSTDTDSSSNISLQGSVIDSASGSESTRPTRAELWNELKMLTFTRTLTTVYTVTLLTLLTTVQLTLLARGRYIRSVVELEKQQRRQHAMTPDLTTLLTMGLGENAEEAADFAAGFGWPEHDEDGEEEEEVASAKYLTMTWWILHVGWKDVGERVRRGVEEVFNGVSLKTKLAPSDLHRLVHDVRRRVEHELVEINNHLFCIQVLGDDVDENRARRRLLKPAAVSSTSATSPPSPLHPNPDNLLHATLPFLPFPLCIALSQLRPFVRSATSRRQSRHFHSQVNTKTPLTSTQTYLRRQPAPNAVDPRGRSTSRNVDILLSRRPTTNGTAATESDEERGASRLPRLPTSAPHRFVHRRRVPSSRSLPQRRLSTYATTGTADKRLATTPPDPSYPSWRWPGTTPPYPDSTRRRQLEPNDTSAPRRVPSIALPLPSASTLSVNLNRPHVEKAARKPGVGLGLVRRRSLARYELGTVCS
ncbi:Peroxin-3-domain-containing protein [Favolaschia claudopus]|uniref:Peroxin-3-domain-containing protein n=1 Tax=Favolaschia claudopus TaxID=2862362 RepID=A0AAW0A1J6_9AGAR